MANLVKRAVALGGLAALAVLAGCGRGSEAKRPAADDRLTRGAYLVSVMDCGGCHTPGALAGAPDLARPLAGSDIGFELPGMGVFYPPNLTPDKATGIGDWTEAQIVTAFRTGVRPDGRKLAPIMPWMAYSHLTDADAAAIAGWLKSRPPVSHRPPGPATRQSATAPYLGVIEPAKRGS